MTDSILRLRQVMARVGRSRSGIYQLIALGEFPKSIKLGARAVGWLESEIDEWILERVNRSRGTR
jgi:prophage regulatory protein